ncbi:hypothetical protein LV85_00925 [Algoriphagus chordae]|uniref:MerC mercury resistance protein n=1 Tax=Algoriphagus chordae TaxID=237019 RepID=A0A2W7RBP9_9BACT|nr:hypothetical protein LV85_00925 [Algoriphagus chordae]
MNANSENKCPSCTKAGTKTRSSGAGRSKAKSLYSICLTVLIALFPKCPFCWATYMSVFGSLGLSRMPYQSWMLPVFMALLAFHLFLLFRNYKSKGPLPILLTLVGVLMLISSKLLWPELSSVLIISVLLITVGSVWNSISIPIENKFFNHFNRNHEQIAKN